MPLWLLLVAIFVVWLLWAIAVVVGKVAVDRARGIPVDKRGGVSIAPVIPVFPLVLWGMALLVDVLADPWGTVVIGSLHAALAVVLVVSIVRDLWRLR